MLVWRDSGRIRMQCILFGITIKIWHNNQVLSLLNVRSVSARASSSWLASALSLLYLPLPPS